MLSPLLDSVIGEPNAELEGVDISKIDKELCFKRDIDSFLFSHFDAFYLVISSCLVVLSGTIV